MRTTLSNGKCSPTTEWYNPHGSQQLNLIARCVKVGLRVDVRTFITKLVSALAWPVTVLFLAAILRKPLAHLITLVRTLKYSDVEIQFGREVAELKMSAAAASIQPDAEQVSERKPAWEELIRLAAVRPRSAIRQAWHLVEVALEELAKARHIDAAPAVWQMPMVLGALTLNEGEISQHQYEMLSKLRELVAEAERAPVDSLNPDDAVEFIGLAMPLAVSLSSEPKSNR